MIILRNIILYCIQNELFVATGSSDSSVYIWRILDLVARPKIKQTSHSKAITSMNVSNDQKYILISTDDKSAKLFETSTGLLIHTIKREQVINSVSFNNDNSKFIISQSSIVESFDTISGNSIKVFNKNSSDLGEIIQIKQSSCGKQILERIIDDENSTARLRSIVDGSIILYYTTQGTYAHTIAISKSSEFVLIGCENANPKLFNALSGIHLKDFVGHTDSISCVEFGSSGNYIQTASVDTSVRVWEINGDQKQVFNGHESMVVSLSVSATEDQLVTGSDKTVVIWDLSNGMRLRKIQHPSLESIISVCLLNLDSIIPESDEEKIEIQNEFQNKLVRNDDKKKEQKDQKKVEDPKIVKNES